MQATTFHRLLDNKTSNRWLIGILALLLSSHAVHAEPTATNVKGWQRPDSTLVDVYYDLSSPAYVSLQVSTNSGSTWTVPVTTVTPSGSERMPAGKGHHILWDAGSDWPNQESKEVRFKVTASETGPLLPPDLISPNNWSKMLTRKPSFAWSDVLGATAYNIIVMSGDVVVINVITTNTTFVPSHDLSLGLYAWNIQTISHQNVSEYSETRFFEIISFPDWGEL